MKNIKLQKKQSFFELYKKYIINVFSFASIIGVILCTYFYPVLMRDIFIIVAKLCGFSIVFVLISLLIDFIIYIKRQLYIPLTKDELDKNGITTVREYNRFLIKYLKGFKPFPKLQEQIIASAKELFLEEWKEIDKTYHYRNYNWTLKELEKYYSREEILEFLKIVETESYTMLNMRLDIKYIEKQLSLRKINENSTSISEIMFDFFEWGKDFKYEEDFIKRISNNMLTREDIYNSENPFYFSYYALELNEDYKELMFHQNLLFRILIISLFILFILMPTLFALMIVFLQTT